VLTVRSVLFVQAVGQVHAVRGPGVQHHQRQIDQHGPLRTPPEAEGPPPKGKSSRRAKKGTPKLPSSQTSSDTAVQRRTPCQWARRRAAAEAAGEGTAAVPAS
jgi:hypothetical protein